VLVDGRFQDLPRGGGPADQFHHDVHFRVSRHAPPVEVFSTARALPAAPGVRIQARYDLHPQPETQFERDLLAFSARIVIVPEPTLPRPTFRHPRLP